MDVSKQCTGGKIAQVLLIIAGLDLGITALGGFTGNEWNVLVSLLGTGTTAGNVFFLLVGLGALLQLASWTKCCSGKCSAGK
jgi:uncharacterized membrane protein YuzA (DUF378 family)